MTEAGYVVHGGIQAAELAALGLDPVDVLDLSANLNPFGPHSHVLQAAREADLRRYPEPHAESLRDAIAARAKLDPSQVLVTAGATDALHLAARALLAPGDSCALWPPTFGEYEAAIAAAGAHVEAYTATKPDFAPQLEVNAHPLGIFCNPNNPTGTYLDRAQVEALQAHLGGTLVLDVAYDPFVAGVWDADDLVRSGTDVLVVHSTTKLHAVPGIRLGYVTGSAEVIARLAAKHPSWSVSATALAAGHAMLAVDNVQRGALDEVTRVRMRLTAELTQRGNEVIEARANFILVRVGAAATFRRALLQRGFAVRDCTSFGLPEYVRVAVPVEAAIPRLLRAWDVARAEIGTSA